METDIIELQQRNEILAKENAELRACRQDFFSAKQSLNRMSTRLRKLCKRLTPTSEIVLEMQKISEEIRQLSKEATSLIEEKLESEK